MIKECNIYPSPPPFSPYGEDRVEVTGVCPRCIRPPRVSGLRDCDQIYAIERLKAKYSGIESTRMMGTILLLRYPQLTIEYCEKLQGPSTHPPIEQGRTGMP